MIQIKKTPTIFAISLAAVGVDYSLSKASFIGLNYIAVTDEQGSTKDITDKTLTFAYSLSF